MRTDHGERVVGSWQAGPPADGLTHYRRRYDDLVTEVALLDQRIDSGAADPASTMAAVVRLREALPAVAVVGDLGSVAQRLDVVRSKAEKRREQLRAERTARAEQALARKRELADEAELLATTGTQWKVAGDRLREIADGWKDIRGADRKADAELWKRLTAARAAFTRRRGAHFAQLDVQRKDSQARKEALCTEADSLAESSDWGPTARRLKELMTQWKAVPHASREVEDALWLRFRGAQDRFFSRRSEAFAERDAANRVKQETRERLVADAEGLDVADPRVAQDRLRDIQARYESAGREPRNGLEDRMHAAEQRVRDAVESKRERASASSNPLLEQMREQVRKAETQLARARAAGDDAAAQVAEVALARRREFVQQAERATR
ncbi:MAG: DUF349 domain-containing protein [Actinomycetota bacterium]|nr:DUF349 domain-containing protein [Actinomycetota bacterium]